MSQPPYQSDPNRQQYPPQGQQQPYYAPQQYQQPPMPQGPGMPPQAQKKPFQMGCAGIAGMMLVGVFIGVFIGYAVHSSAAPTDTTVQANAPTHTTSSAQPTTPAKTTAHHKVGEVVSVDGKWEVTFSQARIDQGSAANQPQKAGNVFLLIDVSMKNISSAQETASSLIQFDLRTADGTQITETIRTDVTAPNGAVDSGSPLKGTLAYEIAPTQHAFEMHFISEIAAQQQTWDIQV